MHMFLYLIGKLLCDFLSSRHVLENNQARLSEDVKISEKAGSRNQNLAKLHNIDRKNKYTFNVLFLLLYLALFFMLVQTITADFYIKERGHHQAIE